MIVTLDQIKEQVNQTLDADDDLLERKIAAAQNHIENLIGFKIEETYGGQDQDPVPAALVHAVSQLAAWWYEQREAGLVGVSAMTVPFGVQDIVREFREYSYGE